MHILLTRPAGRNEALSQRLVDLGHQVSCCPMMEIAAEPEPGVSPLYQADAAFFVSVNAVEHASVHLQQWPEIQYLAIGAATANALRQFGLEPITPPKHDETTEGLWQLPIMQTLAGKRIAIVRGNGGREEMAQRLSQIGCQVDYWQVYRRQVPNFNAIDALQSWQRGGVHAILATSVEILQNLFSTLPESATPWLRQQLWLVPVERVADAAHTLGCQHTLITGGAGDDAIVESIANWKTR